jgi:ABC-type bacteriocin/lantibiotic exporter with double-glycine peptidase domain
MGLLKPDKGYIIVDGKKIKKNQIKNWGRKIGYVPQGTFLIDDTIEKNIAFGISKNSIDRKRLINSAKNAQLHNFVMSLPKKYKSKITERGGNLSEGQKQRISIARALYFNPEILILDEATSALDYKTEKKFINFLLKFKNKKTIIVIAHRYSILKFCQKVYFFDFNKNFRKVEKKYIKQIS